MAESAGALSRAAQAMGVRGAAEVLAVTRALRRHIVEDRCDSVEVVEALDRLEVFEVTLIRFAIANGWTGGDV